MKSIAPIFTILTLATALPKATQVPRADATAGNLERLPICGRSCVDDHWRESRCIKVDDYGCLCLSRSFRAAVKTCITVRCYEKAELEKSEIWVEDTCRIYHVGGLERVARRAQSDEGETRRPPRDGGFRIPERPYDDGHYDDGYHGDGHDGYHRDDNREGHRGVRRDDRDGHDDENRDGYRDDGHRDDGHRDDGHRDDGHRDGDDGHRDGGHRD